MANFRTHLSFGIGSGVVVAVAGIWLVSNLQPDILMLCVFFGYLGGMVPDLDHDHSHSLSYVFSQLTVIFPAMGLCILLTGSSGWAYSILLFLLVGHYFLEKLMQKWLPDVTTGKNARFAFRAIARSLIIAGLGGVVTVIVASPSWGLVQGWLVYMAGAFAVQLTLPLFKKVTVHRGLFHSIPMVLVYTELVYLYLYQLPFWHRVLVTSAAFCGILSHLVLDEVYSVDLNGLRLKKSFGTAVSFWKKKNPILSLLLYLIAAGLFVVSLLFTKGSPYALSF